MARPRKAAGERRSHILNIRLTAEELGVVRVAARRAGLTCGRYAREAVLGRKPRARPAQGTVLQKLLYELHSIATNFRQLADATGEGSYLEWARFVGGQMVEHLVGRDDLAAVVTQHLDAINAAGRAVNSLARAANRGRTVEAAERRSVYRLVREALEPLHRAMGGA